MSLTFTPENFPDEVLALIFSHSNPQALLNAESVNRHWHRAANQPIFWQRFIRQHAPYLIEEQTKPYLNNPKALYKAEFMISAEEKVRQLYEAARNKRFDEVQALLTQPGPQINGESLDYLLYTFVERGNHDVVQVLLANASRLISDESKGNALINSVKRRNFKVVLVLLSLAGHEISARYKCLALEIVRSLDEHLPDMVKVVDVLSSHIFSIEDKGNAILESISSSADAQVIQALSKDVDISYIILALRSAIDYYRQDGVDMILSQRGHELSPAQQIEALGPNGARDYRASKRSIARSLAYPHKKRTSEVESLIADADRFLNRGVDFPQNEGSSSSKRARRK